MEGTETDAGMTGIKALARHLDLSIGTVSRALNNRPDVSEATRRRVLAGAIELGYAPNQSGRSLRAGTTDTVGFFLAARSHGITGSNVFFMEVVGGVQRALAAHGLDLVLLPCRADEDPTRFLERVVARRMVDAMIITATQRHDPRIELLARSRIPFAALGRSQTPSDHPWIDLDFEGVARHATDRLVAQGHRRIAVALPRTGENLCHVFLEAHREALRRHGRSPDNALVLRVASGEPGGLEAAQAIRSMDPRPTAVLLLDGTTATGLYHGLAGAALAPGRDIAVIAFRETRQSRFLTPRLTCYRLAPEELGLALGEALLARMPRLRAVEDSAPVGTIWPMRFVEGDSDGPPKPPDATPRASSQGQDA